MKSAWHLGVWDSSLGIMVSGRTRVRPTPNHLSVKFTITVNVLMTLFHSCMLREAAHIQDKDKTQIGSIK